MFYRPVNHLTDEEVTCVPQDKKELPWWEKNRTSSDSAAATPFVLTPGYRNSVFRHSGKHDGDLKMTLLQVQCTLKGTVLPFY